MATLTGACHCGEAYWTIEGGPGAITACNCTLCCRYGALWAYDYEDERIRLVGPSHAYKRAGLSDPALEIRFCPTCGCVLCWRGLHPRPDGRRRIAVNIRLAAPEAVANLPVVHFDGLDMTGLSDGGRCVRDLWS